MAKLPLALAITVHKMREALGGSLIDSSYMSEVEVGDCSKAT